MKNSPGGSVKVAKRDGSFEMFEFAKLRRSLAAAMRACNYDERYAEALARAVAIHVKEWTDPRPPTTEYVFHCVREVLAETGLNDVASEIVRHRRTRSVLRKRVQVVDTRRTGRAPRPWRKCTVVQSLKRRYDVRPAAARILGGEIEQRVLSLNYPTISTALIAELIRNELMAWGLSEDASSVAESPRAQDISAGHEAGKEH